jgi:hypothetical protein
VLRLADDLERVGIEVKLDILTGSISTEFNQELMAWIRNSNFALMIGSPSYASRARNPTTITFNEVKELAAKKAHNPDGVFLFSIMLHTHSFFIRSNSASFCG